MVNIYLKQISAIRIISIDNYPYKIYKIILLNIILYIIILSIVIIALSMAHVSNNYLIACKNKSTNQYE